MSTESEKDITALDTTHENNVRTLCHSILDNISQESRTRARVIIEELRKKKLSAENTDKDAEYKSS